MAEAINTSWSTPLKNRENVVPRERFDPPQQCWAVTTASEGIGFIYDSRAWRQK